MAVEGISSVASHGSNAAPSVAVAPTPTVSAVPKVTASSTAKKFEQPEAEINGQQGDAVAKEAVTTELSNEKIRKAVEKLNSALEATECRYSFHDDTNRIVIRVVDKETDEVIKEFPAEETLDMIYKAWELAGILVDEKL